MKRSVLDACSQKLSEFGVGCSLPSLSTAQLLNASTSFFPLSELISDFSPNEKKLARYSEKRPIFVK